MVDGETAYFKFNPKAILEEQFFDLIFEEFGPQVKIDYKNSNEAKGRQIIAALEKNGEETKVMSV